MVIIEKEVLDYEKNNIKYYINIPKLCYEENNDKNFLKNEMIESINQFISEDIFIFIDMIEDDYNISKNEYTYINSLTEFQVAYVSKNIISLSVEFSQLRGLSDISYIKAYNYDFNLRKELSLKDFFKNNVDFIELLKRYILIQINNFFDEIYRYDENFIYNFMEDDIVLEEDNIFYFTHEFLIFPFSSCEIHENIVNLLEFKIPFNKIYPYLSEYAMKNRVKRLVL